MVSDSLWGIDLGGTKIEGAILRSTGIDDPLFRDRIPTEAEVGYRHIVSQIRAMVEMMESAAGFRPQKIGIATPGALDPQRGVMKNCNTTCLNGKPLLEDLRHELKMEVTLANDANCFALAETKLGVVKRDYPNAKVVFGVIMGTGVGGGLVVDGHVISGLHGIGGEWGHNFLDETGEACYCGKKGCVEQVLSGPALEKFYASQSGEKRSLKEIVERSKVGDEYAVSTIDRLHRLFGVALSVITNIIDPDVIVIGGGVGNIDSLYSRGRESLERNIFNNQVKTPIVKPILGDSAGVFGAAFL